MAQRKFKAIIFDIGRVLVALDIGKAQQGLAQGHSISPEELWLAIQKDPRWNDWQEGRISPRDWYLRLTAKLKLPLSFEEFTQAWNYTLLPEPIHPDSFFAGLAKRHRMALLSNTDPIHVQKLESTFSFFKYFPADRRIYSCAVGCSKPDAAIYRAALKACQAAAQESVFIDDVEENVKAAEKLGLTGIHFHNPEQLRADLGKLGIIDNL